MANYGEIGKLALANSIGNISLTYYYNKVSLTNKKLNLLVQEFDTTKLSINYSYKSIVILNIKSKYLNSGVKQVLAPYKFNYHNNIVEKLPLPDTQGKVTVLVYVDGNAIEGTTVSAYYKPNKLLIEVKQTNSEGKVTFENLTKGVAEYFFVASRDSYKDTSSGDVIPV